MSQQSSQPIHILGLSEVKELLSQLSRDASPSFSCANPQDQERVEGISTRLFSLATERKVTIEDLTNLVNSFVIDQKSISGASAPNPVVILAARNAISKMSLLDVVEPVCLQLVVPMYGEQHRMQPKDQLETQTNGLALP